MTEQLATYSAVPDARIIELGQRTLKIEARAITSMSEQLGDDFVQAVRLMLACKGRTIVSGIGKTGHIGRKIAATLASTGTPAYFVHAAEAAHGDLGMIADNDVMIAISHSGESGELLTMLPHARRRGAKLIAITGNAQSSLAREADIHLNTHVTEEACPHNLAPTASTTAALALADALAMALLDARGFQPEDFARSHPGGALGRRLLTHVADVMRTSDRVPQILPSTTVADAILAISRGGMGMTVVNDEAGRVSGIFTDGDLRRAFANTGDLRSMPVSQLMSRNPRHIAPHKLAVDAAEIMEKNRINQLLVIDEQGVLKGALSMHDLLEAKVI